MNSLGVDQLLHPKFSDTQNGQFFGNRSGCTGEDGCIIGKELEHIYLEGMHVTRHNK